MNTSFLVFVALSGVTILCLLFPILRNRRRAAPSRDQISDEVVKAKIRQIRQDRDDGLLRDVEAAGAEAELGRLLLSSARRQGIDELQTIASARKFGLILSAVAAVSLGAGLYASLGSWQYAAHEGQSARASAIAAPNLLSEHEGSMMSDAIGSLKDRLVREPDNVENWRLLARTYAALGAYDAAADAYENLIKLAPLDIGVRGDYAENLIRAQEGFVGPVAVKELETVLVHAPNDPRARYYLALRDAQAGDSLSAARGWAAVLSDAPPDAPYRPAILEILQAIVEDAGLDSAAFLPPDVASSPRMAPGPTAADIEAAGEMSDADQLEMIKTMVARLESRLQEDPGDVDGWVRLARSKSVLGDGAGAVDTLRKGLSANPGDPVLTQALSNLGG